MDAFRRNAQCLARKSLMTDSAPKQWYSVLCLVIVTVGLTLAATGCATTQDDDSDLPWNVRQPWEGAPTIPGMGQH